MNMDTEDMLEIYQLLARYTLLADVKRDHEAMRRIFTSDGSFNVPAIDLFASGIENIVAFFRDREGGDHHINTNIVIDAESDSAVVNSYVHIIKAEQGVKSLVFGRYEDELLKTEQGWRIKVRTVVLY